MTARTPTIKQCLDFHEQYEMFDNIRAHSLMVARVTVALVDGLHGSSKILFPLPDKKEAVAGALLHDIAKTLCIKSDCRHAEIGRQICLELGYPEISEIVAEHVVLKKFTADLYAQGIFGTKEIVFYADKRVLHDLVVSLEGRLEYILKRYGAKDPAREHLIRQNFHQALELEKYLFHFLGFAPEEIFKHISYEQFSTTG